MFAQTNFHFNGVKRSYSCFVNMDRWVGKVAVVTGASAGIGASIVEKLVESGLQVAGFARRRDLLEELAKNLEASPGKLHPVKCDLRNENEIVSAFKWVKENLGTVHILVNNAGVLKDGFVHSGKTEEWRMIFDTNVIGLCICTREGIQQMLTDKIDGHVVHINSIAGHQVTHHDPPAANVYPASKYAVTALTESLRQEMVYLKNKIKVTSISPGLTLTDMFSIGSSERFSEDKMKEMPYLLPEDVANAVMFTLSTPPHVQIHELTIKPVGEEV